MPAFRLWAQNCLSLGAFGYIVSSKQDFPPFPPPACDGPRGLRSPAFRVFGGMAPPVPAAGWYPAASALPLGAGK